MNFEKVQIIYDEFTPELETNIIRSIRKATEEFLAYSHIDEGFVTLLFCSESKISELNRIYRDKNSSTDILSWSYDEETHGGSQQGLMPWGELAICLKVCERQAINAGWDLESELLRLIAHGIIHLRG